MVTLDLDITGTTNQSDDQTRFLVLGDTHVGYRHRSKSKKSKWADSADDLVEFRRALSLARDLQVDAVVHAGDVFDHQNTQKDRSAVTDEIDRTVDAGIPFFYIYGNHDDRRGRKSLTSTSGTHLSDSTPTVGASSVSLLGFDHTGRDFPTRMLDPPSELSQNQNILVIHESPHPVVDETGSLLYQKDPNRAEVSSFIESADFDIDLLITGHLHVADQPRIRGHDIPVLVTGPTVPISSYEGESNPSTWLLTTTDSGIDLERQPV
jgi:DNA repair exonuclease SbcCD nuclease subunit